MIKCQTLKINGQLCKNNNYNVNNIFNSICYIHYKKKYLESQLTISRNYRGYRARRYLKLFTLLPQDLQYKIQFYMRESIILKKHQYKIIKSTLNNRFYNDYLYKLREDPYELFEKIRINRNSISNIYKLYNKYYLICDINILRWLSKIVNILLSLCIIFKLDDNFKTILVDFYILSKTIKFKKIIKLN